MIQTIFEWYKCLVDQEYAKTTWLRVFPDHENKALFIMDCIIIILLIAALITSVVAIYKALQVLEGIRHLETLIEG